MKTKAQGAKRPVSTDDHYATISQQFRWSVPEHFNMASWCARRWAERADGFYRTAIIDQRPGPGSGAESVLGGEHRYSYQTLQLAANKLSHALTRAGVKRGDRVAIVMPQRFETAVAYIALLQMGAVGMPLSQLFGPQALAYRFQDSQAVAAIVDASTVEGVSGVLADCPSLQLVVEVGGDDGRMSSVLSGATQHMSWASTQGADDVAFEMVDTLATDPAVLIYTSGTTGNPKGALIPHSALIGNLTGFIASQNWFGYDPLGKGCDAQGLPLEPMFDTVFWSPADWAWTGGLMDALLPCLVFGRPIVAFSGRFSSDAAFEILQRHRVTHSFLFPTALKAMMKAYPKPKRTFHFNLHALMSAGEAVGDAVFSWCANELGIVVNEMFGQTEVNYIVGNCAMNNQRSAVGWPAKPGSMGKGYPGHTVDVIDDNGDLCADDVIGEVAVKRFALDGQPDPVFFIGYWNNPEATTKKFTGDWCRTGDLARRDADGYLWYAGRTDDMFKAAGYRIGPGEIENCLVKHPAVLNAAVVPKPDKARGATVKAFVVLAPDVAAHRAALVGDARIQWDDKLVADLQTHVRGKLAPYEYPKDVEFVDALPMTTTGKVQRRVLRLLEETRAKEASADV